MVHFSPQESPCARLKVIKWILHKQQQQLYRDPCWILCKTVHQEMGAGSSHANLRREALDLKWILSIRLDN